MKKYLQEKNILKKLYVLTNKLINRQNLKK